MKFAFSLLIVLGCSDATRAQPPGPGSRAPQSGAPAAAPPAAQTPCQTDAECTGKWTPMAHGCGSIERCSEGACKAPAASTGEVAPETAIVKFDGPSGEVSVNVEVVRSGFETSRGLMCRPSMKSDWGMVFFLGQTQVQRFWMKNTLIPLDMVFIREDWTVAGLVPDVPPLTLEGRGIPEPTRYVLELSAGQARRLGLVAGTRLRYFARTGF